MTLIQFNTAKLAKEKGFNQNYCAAYNNLGNLGHSILSDSVYDISAPTQSELQGWLRDIHEIDIVIDLSLSNLYNKNERNYFVDIYCTNFKTHPKIDGYIQSKGVGVPENGGSHKFFTSHELALEEALLESLKLIENGNN